VPPRSRRERGKDAASISFQARCGRLEAESDRLDRASLTRVARRVFSLDVDLGEFARTLSSEPRLARALAQGRGRMLRAPALFEDAVKMLLTTNCSWAATKGMVVRLIGEAGAEGRAFPTAEAVAGLTVAKLKSRIRCGYRAEALARLARRVARGNLSLADWERPEAPAEEIRAAILAEHGFGPYAAEGLLRILGRHDFLAIDSWVRQEYRRRFHGPRRTTDRAIARRYARYGAHRGLALWLEMTSHWHA
jgi:3-methyladenine DNA glycosylase/8-oxoguanine DNA glycosylase